MSLRILWLLAALLTTACSELAGPAGGGAPQTFTLEVALPAAARPAPGAPLLLVAPPEAAAGYDGRRMVYTERPFELQYFVRNEWADTPARMLEPLLVRRLEAAGAFSAVVTGAAPVTAELRLDSRLLSFEQRFAGRPSRGRVALRVQLTDLRQGRVVATRHFEAEAAAPSDDPYGGVQALNRALEEVLGEVARFAAAAVAQR